MIEIHLTREEEEKAVAMVKERRQISRDIGLKQSAMMRDDLRIDIIGGLGEMAVAKFLGCEVTTAVYTAQGKSDAKDVGPVEVRSSELPTSSLIIRPKDFDETPYILVRTHKRPCYHLMGWLLGKDGKQKKYERNPGNHGLAYFIPAQDLFTMETLPVDIPTQIG